MRYAVDVHERRERYGWASASCVISAPPFEWPITGTALRARDVVEHSDGVTEIGVPRIQLAVLAVAVTAMIPAHDPPPEGRQLGGEHIERAGEIEAAVHQHQWRRATVSPFVDGDANAVRIDVVAAIGATAPGNVTCSAMVGEVMAA